MIDSARCEERALLKKRLYKWPLVALGVFGLAVGAVSQYYGLQLVAIGTAYTAKTICSGIFVAQRDLQSLLDVDMSADDLAPLRHIDVQVDRQSRQVTSSFFGLRKQIAVYREGQGCVVVVPEIGLPAASQAREARGQIHDHEAVGDTFSIVNGKPPVFDRSRLETALEWAFSESVSSSPRRTRAVVIIHKGRLIAERYAPGFTKETPLLGWSMTKSVVNALVGILVREGKIILDGPVSLPEWQAPTDPRRTITFNHLLRMTSGLQFNEVDTDPFSDVTYMLLGVADTAGYAAAKPLTAEPGRHWSYSSGTTNILTYAMRGILGESVYREFPRRALFDRLGMTSAVLETDASGTFIGSSFMYATARDWARLGLLYLNDGVWLGEPILPKGWVAYTRIPAPGTTAQEYGAHVWLKIPQEYRCGEQHYSLPPDAFHAVGHEGQFVTIIPSRHLVLVRLGLTRLPCAWDHQYFVQAVLDAIG